jgi:hypothetical protein
MGIAGFGCEEITCDMKMRRTQIINFKILLPILVYIMTLVTVSPALALENTGFKDNESSNRYSDSVPSSISEVQPHQGDTFVRTTVLAGSGVDQYGGNLNMRDVDAGFNRKFSVNSRLELFSGLHYSIKDIEAPEDARLPSSLHCLALNIGGSYRMNDNLSLGLMALPGLNSDFKVITWSDMRVPVALNVHYLFSPKLTLTGGLMYAIGNHELPLMPVIGAIYRPSENWIFALGFPRTGVMFKPNKTAEYYIGGEFGGGEYRLHDADKGADIISYRDYRAVTGADWTVCPDIKLGITGGYSFARKFLFDGERDDVNVHSALFGRFELKFMW